MKLSLLTILILLSAFFLTNKLESFALSNNFDLKIFDNNTYLNSKTPQETKNILKKNTILLLKPKPIFENTIKDITIKSHKKFHSMKNFYNNIYGDILLRQMA